MASDTTTLNIAPRETEGSRSNRRMRRAGRVPGVLYGGDQEPLSFSVDDRELRHALRQGGAVVELSLEGQTSNAVLKDFQRDPVRGDMWHVDFVRVRMDVAIQTQVVLELTGADEAPGTSEGGVLEQATRELNIEALPGDIPDVIEHDVSSLEINDTVHLSDVAAPKGVTFLDDPETVVASVIVPRLEVETPDEVETETELVGEGEEGAEAEGEAEGEASGESGDGDGDSASGDSE